MAAEAWWRLVSTSSLQPFEGLSVWVPEIRLESEVTRKQISGLHSVSASLTLSFLCDG